MRHGSLPASSVPLLAEGVPPGPLGGLLVAQACRPDRFPPADGRALLGAERLPVVAPGADPDLLPALPAIEDPVALLDGCRTRRTWPWTIAARELILFVSSLAEPHITETRASRTTGSPFLFGLRFSFYSMELPRASDCPSPPAPPQGERSTPASPSDPLRHPHLPPRWRSTAETADYQRFSITVDTSGSPTAGRALANLSSAGSEV